jgi:hypothetical protein
MAAGLGFKTFTTGEVLTAADTNGYLMQGILVFASAAARDAAITSPQEGQFAYLKDTNVTTYYTGSAWANVDTTGMTNPMTTTGDSIYSSSGSTPARLGIGSTGQVLTVASGLPSWATPASGGGMTLINISGTTLSGSSVSISSIPTSYVDLRLIVENYRPGTDGAALFIQYNSDTGSNYRNGSYTDSWAVGSASSWASTANQISPDTDNGTSNASINVYMPNYSSASTWKPNYCASIVNDNATPANFRGLYFAVPYNASAAITSLTLSLSTGSFTSGTAYVYGVK